MSLRFTGRNRWHLAVRLPVLRDKAMKIGEPIAGHDLRDIRPLHVSACQLEPHQLKPPQSLVAPRPHSEHSPAACPQTLFRNPEYLADFFRRQKPKWLDLQRLLELHAQSRLTLCALVVVGSNGGLKAVDQQLDQFLVQCPNDLRIDDAVRTGLCDPAGLRMHTEQLFFVRGSRTEDLRVSGRRESLIRNTLSE